MPQQAKQAEQVLVPDTQKAIPVAEVQAELVRQIIEQDVETDVIVVASEKHDPSPVTTQSIVTEESPAEILDTKYQDVREVVQQPEEPKITASESPPAAPEISQPMVVENLGNPSVEESVATEEISDEQAHETENITYLETSATQPEIKPAETVEAPLAIETPQPEEYPVAIQNIPTGLETTEIPIIEELETDASSLEVEATPHIETDELAYEAGKTQTVVHSLESFETFVDGLHDVESSPEKLEIVHEKVEKIHELTIALQEAELLDSDTAVERLQEELVQTFVELFAETGVKISEEQVRKLVQLWIQHDVLSGADFDQARAELFDDKGMHEILKQFLHGVAYVKQILENIQTRLGRLVIADAQKLSLQS